MHEEKSRKRYEYLCVNDFEDFGWQSLGELWLHFDLKGRRRSPAASKYVVLAIPEL
jgi:hypothetical protein